MEKNALKAVSTRPGVIKLNKVHVSAAARKQKLISAKFDVTYLDLQSVESGWFKQQSVALYVPLTDFGERDLPQLDPVYDAPDVEAEVLFGTKGGFSRKAKEQTIDAAYLVQASITAAALEPTIVKLYADILLQTLGARLKGHTCKYPGPLVHSCQVR